MASSNGSYNAAATAAPAPGSVKELIEVAPIICNALLDISMSVAIGLPLVKKPHPVKGEVTNDKSAVDL